MRWLLWAKDTPLEKNGGIEIQAGGGDLPGAKIASATHTKILIDVK